MTQSKVLQEAVLILHLIQNRIYGLQQKILFLRNMIIHLRISSMIFLKLNTKKNSMRQELNISTHLLMMQLPVLWDQRADTSGHVKTMMVTLCLIWLLQLLVHYQWWHLFLHHHMDIMNMKLLMEQFRDIIISI